MVDHGKDASGDADHWFSLDVLLCLILLLLRLTVRFKLLFLIFLFVFLLNRGYPCSGANSGVVYFSKLLKLESKQLTVSVCSYRLLI